MRISALSASLLAVTSAALATALPAEPQAADGLYSSFFDESGNEVTQFIPWDERGNTTFVPIVSVIAAAEISKRSTGEIVKRAEGCHATQTIPDSVTDQANKCLIDSFSNPHSITGNGVARRSVCFYLSTLLRVYSNLEFHIKCVYSNARSYYCAYNSGPIIGGGTTTTKYKSDIAGSWDYVKRTLCGRNRLGYAQVIGGRGSATAGYTFNGDGYCW